MPEEKKTFTAGLRAELGFFGVIIIGLKTSPFFWGQARNVAALGCLSFGRDTLELCSNVDKIKQKLAYPGVCDDNTCLSKEHASV